MALNLKIHSASHLLKAVLGNIEKISGGLNYSGNELIVVNYHSTPVKFIDKLEQQILFYKQNFNVIAPVQLGDYYRGRFRSGKCNLLITFDDGLRNNLHAADLLEKHELRAFFFVVPGFIESPLNEQKEYYLKHIRPVVNQHVDSEAEDLTAFTWPELQKLQEKGHLIGSHTYSHTLNTRNTNEENSKVEIVESGKKIAHMLGAPVTSFCSINNSLESTGSLEKKLIRENYSFHFTTLPGLNAEDKDPFFIRRRNVECFWLKGAIYYTLGKADLKRWRKDEVAFKSL